MEGNLKTVSWQRDGSVGSEVYVQSCNSGGYPRSGNLKAFKRGGVGVLMVRVHIRISVLGHITFISRSLLVNMPVLQ
jgi:hypothetical protein